MRVTEKLKSTETSLTIVCSTNEERVVFVRRRPPGGDRDSLDYIKYVNLRIEHLDGHSYPVLFHSRQQTLTFLSAGQDTTSALITWCLYFLAAHPHIQEKIQEVECSHHFEYLCCVVPNVPLVRIDSPYLF